MSFAKPKLHRRSGYRLDNSGFTMIEVLVAAAVGAIVLVGAVSSYTFLLKTYRGNKDFTVCHTKLRGTSAVLTMAAQASGRSGLNPGNASNFGVTDISFYDLDGNPDPNGFPAVTFTTLENDIDGNGYIDDQDWPPSIHTYALQDNDNDGRPDLVFIENDATMGGLQPPVPVAFGVDVFSIAYAVDNDRDGIVDPDPAGGTMWCIDTNNDNVLDRRLDSHGDGAINEADDTDGDGFIDLAVIAPVPMTRIRQVKMWLLVRSDLSDPDYTDLVAANGLNQRSYHVGHMVVPPQADGFRRRVVTRGITLRNTEGDLQL